MSNHAPTSVVRRLFDAINAQDILRAVDQLHADFRGVDATRSVVTTSRDEAEREIRAGLTAFPDLTLSVEQCIADSSQVSVFWGLDATHGGSFLDIPPTGQSVHVSGTGLFTVRDGRIVRAVHLWDLAGFLRAIRLLPDLPR
jgi:steroid delta-isomerase-like uncharacterized protein